ncbi:TPA: hypothetical protein QDZ28_000541 [Pseudomonas putida]|nr:hypothetical protein [Pseudomonas putida]
MSRTLALFAVACSVFVCAPAAAFGLKTHLWIGQQIIAEVNQSCRIRIGDVPLALEPALCSSIRNHPKAFLAGTLGPDAYPDIVTGQVTTHPGIHDDWRTSDWLIHLYGSAQPGAELAFSAGYLVHAASDVFAHTYVNAYSGDIFVLSDERAVERRHFVLEKYIDSKLPGFSIASADLKALPDYLSHRLIFDSSAGRTANKSGVAGHISAMNGVRVSVEHFARQLDELEQGSRRLLDDFADRSIDLNAQVGSGEVQLKLARESLALRDQQVALMQKARNETEAAFNQAVDALQRNEEMINLNTLEARTAAAAAEAARQAVFEGINTVARLKNSLADLNKQLRSEGTTIDVRRCRTVVAQVGCHSICPGVRGIPGCREVCDEVRRVTCHVVNEANKTHSDLTGQIASTDKQMTNAAAAVTKASMDLAANTAKETVARQKKLAAESQNIALQAARDTAKAAFDLKRVEFEAEQGLTATARKTVDDAAARLAMVRQQLIDTDAIRDGIQELVGRSSILSRYAHNWSNGIVVAGREYINTSHRVAMGLLAGESHFVSEYLQWMQCYGSAFTPKPYQVDEGVCKALAFYEHLDNEFNKLVERVLPPPFDELHRRLEDLKVQLKVQVKQATEEAALKLAVFIAPDATTGDFIELLARSENASAAKLNEVFATAGDSEGKNLLRFDAIATQINEDIGLKHDRLDPDRFAALKHARTLSKMALLDVAGLRNLVWVLGGDPAQIPDSSTSGRYSVLYSMVRSIDGNHQWQPYGLPYARMSGAPVPSDPEQRRFGHGKDQPNHGFVLFTNTNLRHTVFGRVFDRPVSGALARHPRLAADSYPFPECETNPFPMAMTASGAYRDADPGCAVAAGDTESAQADYWEWARRLLNRLNLSPH